MRISKLLKELDKNACIKDMELRLHGPEGKKLAGVVTNDGELVLVADADTGMVEASTIGSLKEAVTGYNKDMVVKAADDGSEVFYVLSYADSSAIWIETAADVDLENELEAIFENAVESGDDELDIYTEMIEIGFTPEHVEKYIGTSEAEHMREFCESHGLL